MRYILFTLLFGGMVEQATAQIISFAPDTLLKETFEIDPSEEMLSYPNGDDIFWVNWDKDGAPTNCAFDPENGFPLGTWYWEYDLGIAPSSQVNNAFTSCSFGLPAFRNQNWLITPPIYVEDSTYALSWRSLALQGPFLTDGYHVLISETGNFPANFTDTIFGASETTTPYAVSYSLGFPLDVSKYTFSPGYLHANSYTDTAYFKISEADGTNFYQGKMEPHRYWLKDYVGKSVYVAFLHDSYDDYILQLDDILVARDALIATTSPNAQPFGFQIQPNPASDQLTFQWQLDTPVLIRIFSATGQLCWQSPELEQGSAPYKADLTKLPSGVYHCVLHTNAGMVSQRLIKI
ncbi:MAG: T9SS type A sorting domain-containing protein [Saprospiraceae bacterium]